MQRYQPPHARQRQDDTSQQVNTPLSGDAQPFRPSGPSRHADVGYGRIPKQHSSRDGFGSSTAYASGSSTKGTGIRQGNNSLRSKRDWSAPGSSVLASPASDIKPMRSRASTLGGGGGRGSEMDEMEMLQSVSRSGGDGAEGDALKDWAMQERYQRYIGERLEKHHATFSTRPDVAPPTSASEELQSLKSIVLLLRKLREGVVASHRIDDFAIEVFESSARIAILARDPPQLISALSGLVPGLYTAVADIKGKGKARANTNRNDMPNTSAEALGEELRDLKIHDDDGTSCRTSSTGRYGDQRPLFASILLLYHLAHSDSRKTFHSTLISLTSTTRHALRRRFQVDEIEPPASLGINTTGARSQEYSDYGSFMTTDDLNYAVRASRSLAQETFNPLAYFALLADTDASPYERAVLAWAETRVKERAWEVMKRVYLSCGVSWVGKWLGMDEVAVAGWMKDKGGTIQDGKIPMR